MARITLEATLTAAPEDVDVLLDALGPEDEEEFPGVDTRLEREADDRARLLLSGTHAPNVRAAMNAYLTWVRTVEEVLDVDPGGTNEVP